MNPFTFPTETDGRFLLLVLAIGGVIFGVCRWLLYAYTDIPNDLVVVAISLAVVAVVFIWARQRAKRAARWEISAAEWQSLDHAKVLTAERAGFDQFQDKIQDTVSRLPEVAATLPAFLWDGRNRTATGRAFGYGGRQYVLLRRGLYDAFWVNYDAFLAILLHELAHVANRDVSKTTFSIQLGRCFYVTAGTMAALLLLYLVYLTTDTMIADTSLTSMWSGALLFLEGSTKLLLLFLLVEIIRSSVLRVRENYADYRAMLWMGKTRPLLQLILHSQQSKNRVREHQQTGVQRWFRERLAPFHPAPDERVQGLKDWRQLFRLRNDTTFLGALVAGLALNSLTNIASALVFELGPVMDFINERTLAASNHAFAPILFAVGNFVLFAAFAILLVSLLVVGVRPIIATIGVQMQMAAFADQLQSKHSRFLTWSVLIRHALLFGLGLILGFFLTPTAGPLSPGTFAINASALLLWPVYVLGWAIVFLAWAIPLYQMAGRLYTAHRTQETPLKKRKSLQRLSALGLLPLLVAMAATQILLGELGGSAGMDTSSLILTIPGWTIAFIISSLVWIGAWVLFGIRGWLNVDSDQNHAPLWTLYPGPYPLPEPPHLLPDLSGPPPL